MLASTTLVVSSDGPVNVFSHALTTGGHSVAFAFTNGNGDSQEVSIVVNGDDSRARLVSILTDALTKAVNTL